MSDSAVLGPPPPTVPPPKRVRGELRRSLLGWMLLVSLAPLLLMAAQGYHCGMQAVVEKNDEHIRSILDGRRAITKEWFDQRFAELDVLASAPSIVRCCAHYSQLSEAEIETETTVLLHAVQRGVRAYDHLGVYGRDWTRIAMTENPGDASTAPPEEIRRALEAGEEWAFTQPHANADGSVGVWLAKALFDGSGQRIGAILGDINITRGVAPLLQERAGLGATGKVYLATASGALITKPLANEPAETLAAPVDLHAQPEAAIHSAMDIYGRPVLRAATTMTRPGWNIVVEIDEAETSAWLDTLAWRTALTGAITIVVLLVISFWISDRLGRPLGELARVAQRIRAGHTSERVGPVGGAEADQVRQAFNAMLDTLREKQQALIQAATLASVGELTSTIVHEVRNPLSSIKMNLQALEKRVEGDGAYEELAQIAASQVRRLEAMLDDLLQYGRPVEPRLATVRFSDLSNAAFAVAASRAQTRNVTLDAQDATNNAAFYADPELLCRALSNLLLNAIDASPQGGSVILRGALDPAREQILIDVLDAGEGLAPESRDRVFQPFFTTKAEGAGLGLANVKKIVELHHGAVQARNRPEGGAVFSIQLPRREAA